jgi:hypothetical protein
MKISRVSLLATAALAILLAAAVILALNSGFQTWAARRILAAQPEPRVTLGALEAGPGRVVVRDLRAEFRGAVLTLPSAEADLTLPSAAVGGPVLVTRLVAKGWTLDLSRATALAEFIQSTPAAKIARADGEFSLLPSMRAADATPVGAHVFQGLFSQLNLPFDLSLDGVLLEGEVMLPGARGHARVALRGGGLAAGREGRFELSAGTALTSAAVSSIDARAVMTVAMDSPRTLDRLGVNAEATASGASFPGVRLSVDAVAARAAKAENYRVTLKTEKKQLLALEAALPQSAKTIDGLWSIDASDADLAPFSLGRALPTFTVEGAGRFELEPTGSETHLSGKLAVTAENLGMIQPKLSALGRIRVESEFDLAQTGEVTRVEKLTAAIFGARPVASVSTLQVLGFNRVSRSLKVADPARDLLALQLQGVPVAWLQPWLAEPAFAGDDLRGEFFALANEGGFSLRSKSPLVAAGLTVTQAGKPMVRNLGVSMNASFDYTPLGWQASLDPLTFRAGDAPLLTLEAKAGQLAGADQPIKAAGKIAANLAALLAQPVASGVLALNRGDASGEFAFQMGKTQALQAKLTLANLVADPRISREKLPVIALDLRADLSADGQLAVSVPVRVERSGRSSDLAVNGTITPGKSGPTVAARVSSKRLWVDDLRILAAPWVANGAEEPVGNGPAAKAAVRSVPGPPWAGIGGRLSLELQEVVWSDAFRADKISGVVQISEGAVKLDEFRAGVGDGGEVRLAGTLSFDPRSTQHYLLTSDLNLREFDPAPLFRALDPTRPATVEGKLASRASSRAARRPSRRWPSRFTVISSSVAKAGCFAACP